MKNKIWTVIPFIIIVLLLAGCSSVTKVAIMTKLESGSLVGISEVDSAKLFLKSNKIENIEIIPYDDGWNPERVEDVYNEIREDGIDIIIASHTSSCALELLDIVNNEDDPVIVFITGSTTDRLSRADDNIYRVIQDVEKEQRSIAEHIETKSYENILVIKGTENLGYTDPAEEYFEKYYEGNINIIDINAKDFDSSELELRMIEYPFDAVYLLIGGYQTNSGVIAQLAVKINHEVDIYYTPWMKTPNILDTAGKSINQSIMPSHYPARGTDEKIDSYLDMFESEYEYVPTFISLNIYKTMEIINQNILQGKSDPTAMKDNIDSIRMFKTKIGPVYFDEFGDTDSKLHFIEDIKREFE